MACVNFSHMKCWLRNGENPASFMLKRLFMKRISKNKTESSSAFNSHRKTDELFLDHFSDRVETFMEKVDQLSLSYF